MAESRSHERSARERALDAVEGLEDAIYAAIAVFLLLSGAGLLVGAAYNALGHLDPANISATVITVLDQSLLVFMVAELLHTVRITLRDRSLAAEPFLIIGVIAGVRRILILTARNEEVQAGPALEAFWVQMVLLIGLVLAMVIALVVWRRAYPKGDPHS